MRDAATVVVLRAGPRGLEALMLRRHAGNGFAPGTWVFPGGAVGQADRALPPERRGGIDPEALRERFALPAERVVGMHVAAVRETFEEAGLLFARHEDGAPAQVADDAAAGRTAAPGAFGSWLAERGLVLDPGALTYWSRWVTPAGSPGRYDTCFFLARVVAGQVADHDRTGTTAQRWMTPVEALGEDLRLVLPTACTLEGLSGFADPDQASAYGPARREVRRNESRPDPGSDGRPVPALET